MIERGKIKNKDFARQIRDFRKLKYINVTPTDLDGLIEFNNCIFIFIETKYFKKPELPDGQKRALVNLVDSVFEASKKGLLIIATHNKPSNESIPFHNCKVIKYRSRKHWYSPKEITVKKLIDSYLKKNCIDCPDIKCSANKYIKGIKG